MKVHFAARLAVMTIAWLSGITSHAAAQTALDQLADNPPLFLETARKASKWDEPAEPAKIIGPIHFVGTKGLGVFLIATADGHIVLNTGMPGSGPMIEASIRKLGFKPEEIKLLLTTQSHIDHVGGHAYLKKLSGARNAVIREDKDLFESGGKLDFHYGRFKEFEFEPAKVDLVLRDDEVLKLGDVAIKVLLTNGHTRGSTSYVLDVVDGGKTYKVIVPDGTGINPGYRLVKDPSYAGIQDDYRRTLRILEAEKPDVWLRPHNDAYDFEEKLARSAKEGARAWVDPEGYKKWVDSRREKFEATVKKETAADAKPN